MSMNRQTILASRPAAMVLALSLVTALSAPFLVLPPASAASGGGTASGSPMGTAELSPTPPQDTVAVPPNILLMLDDSGSMNWNFMPDWEYLQNNGNNDAVINSGNNGVYYNPTVTYTPPPLNNGTSNTNYTDMTDVPEDGFGVRTTAQVNLYTYDGSYDYYQCGGGVCNGSAIEYNVSMKVPSTTTNTYDDYASSKTSCKNTYNSYSGNGGYTYTAHSGTWYLNGTKHKNGGECVFQYQTTTYKTYSYFQYSTGPAAGPYVVHYVASAAQGCGSYSATTTPDCVLDSASSGLKDANGNDITVGQNIANWFAYYHTRILMAKSGLMTAFNNLDPKYRFGFGSIDGNNKGAISSLTAPYSYYQYTDGNGNTNYIAEVYPFGAALDVNGNNNTNSRRYQFWDWITNERANNGTPLRIALRTTGKYYQTSQPWQSMTGDPGYSGSAGDSPLACRASYTIMTTDGFWNGNNPNVGDADGTAGTTYTDITGSNYGYTPAPPFSDSANSNTLADVAMQYWKTDLQSGIANEVPTNPQDPAFWQHMVTFTMGLGFSPLYADQKTVIPVDQVFKWAQDVDQGKGATSSYAIAGFSWPTPSANSINNIADLAHAAVNGHGDFFSVKSPQELAAGFAKAISEINARVVPPSPSAVNASVISSGALSFSTGYNTGDWSGAFRAVTLQSNGSVDKTKPPIWDANVKLDAAYHSAAGYKNRKVYTAAYKVSGGAGTFSSFQFNVANVASLDSVETAGLSDPPLVGGNDTLNNRIAYLLGDNSYETGAGAVYRPRTTLLGAILHSQPVYVSYPSGNYYNTWPSGSPEIATGAQTYDAFVTAETNRAGTVYLGANDGMLHAFDAALVCNPDPADSTKCLSYGPAQQASAGNERWAFIPRAVYANLGNLTGVGTFYFRPTVDATPVTRDVFFGESGAANTDNKWHTMLASGVGLGGRGVYALDITDPTNPDFSSQPMDASKYPASGVMWEFDADMPATSGCVSNVGSCLGTDLGYTVSQPNIGRVKWGNRWVVLVPNGYFPDCSKPDTPTNDTTKCQQIQKQAPVNYSALFVLDAQTGAMIAELKTPTTITGVTSFGLATPVMGDYQNDQVDDVAFAGDLQGNLWRFDLSGATPSDWTVALVYKGVTDASSNQGVQPITTMPRLFPDPTTNRFMVVFGTGKYLGVGDNTVQKNPDGSYVLQSIYGVRDAVDSGGTQITYSKTDLVQQTLSEAIAPATLPNGDPNPYAGTTQRLATNNAVAASKGGWYMDLKTTTSDGTQNDAGERVVVSPGAIFASNTVVIQTLITGGMLSDPCNPATQGALMFLDALTGSPGNGVSSLGGKPVVGGRVNNVRTYGNLPLVSSLGGGQVYLPGVTLQNTTNPFVGDLPIWRRRSWNEINQNQ